MANTYNDQVQPITILSAVPARMGDDLGVVLVVRPDPTVSHASKNVFVSMDQAHRLHEDLGTLLRTKQPVWEQ
jgi:hypothetical protein